MHTNDNTATSRPADDGAQTALAPPRTPLWTDVRANAGAATTLRRLVADPAGRLLLLVSVVVAVVLVFALVLGIARYRVTVHLISDPIAAWLDAHLAGLPITTPTAAWCWGGFGLVLVIAATFGHLAARVLWVGYGAATAAAAWAGATTDAHRPIAAAAVAIVWALLSLPALSGAECVQRNVIRDYDSAGSYAASSDAHR